MLLPVLRLVVPVVVVVLTATVRTSSSQTVQNGRNKNCADLTRVRKCSPWGLSDNSKNMNPAFRYDYADPLNECNGVINTFYFFKISVFGSQLETAVQMRAVKGIAEVMWNINAHFHPTATDTLGKLIKKPSRRMTKSLDSIRNRNIALAYGLARVSEYLIPGTQAEVNQVLDLLMIGTGLDASTTHQNLSTPEGVGNRCAAELIAYMKEDGWNSEGDLSPGARFPFADYTNFIPVNSPYKITDPTSWQPLLEHTGGGYYQAQTLTCPQLRSYKVKPWALTKKFIARRQGPGPGWKLPMTGQMLQWYKNNVTQLLNMSATLSQKQKLLIEFFDAKVISFGGLKRWYSFKRNWCHDNFIAFEQLSSCIYDATIVAWKEKARTNAIRPISAVRWLAEHGHLKNITAWGGPGQGPTTMPANEWQSYVRTMPHTEYPSGTACHCAVVIEWLKKFQNSDRIDLSLEWQPGCSSVEPGVTPQKPLKVEIGTLKEMEWLCSRSRMWAGVHFEAATRDGLKVCSGIANKCFAKVQRMWKGRL